MRSLGIPLYGTGRIFRPDESLLVIDPFNLDEKPWLRVIKGLDVGIAHPTAVAWLAYDPRAEDHLSRAHLSRIGRKGSGAWRCR